MNFFLLKFKAHFFVSLVDENYLENLLEILHVNDAKIIFADGNKVVFTDKLRKYSERPVMLGLRSFSTVECSVTKLTNDELLVEVRNKTYRNLYFIFSVLTLIFASVSFYKEGLIALWKALAMIYGAGLLMQLWPFPEWFGIREFFKRIR